MFIRTVNTIVTEIRISNFYLEWKWNHFVGLQLQINIEFFFLIYELISNFNLHYFCFSVNYLNLIELKKCWKILSELTLYKVNVSH